MNCRRTDVVAAIALEFAFAWLFAIVLFVPVVLSGFIRRKGILTNVLAALTATYFLLWFVRIETAHQMLSIRPHLSGQGIVALAGIALAAVLIHVFTERFRGGRSVIAFVAVVVGTSVALETLARAQVPPRRRDDGIRRLAPLLNAPRSPVSIAPRLLMIGIDGLDWRVVARLVAAEKLPNIASLLREGRSYQMDNLGMRVSSEIWTTIYTSVPVRENGIDGFLRWNFAGVRDPIVTLPKFGVHTVFLIERILRVLSPVGPWSSTVVNNTYITAPLFWTRLSQAGRKVLAVTPLPMQLVPEKLDGTFVVPSRDAFFAFGPGGALSFPHPAASPTSPRGIMRDELHRLRTAVGLLRSQHYDAAVYYAHVVDGVSHLRWDFASPGFIKHDRGAAAIEASSFLQTEIAAAYLQADATVGQLIEAFGKPATVVLVSDHGWEFSEYEHFASPFGMFVVSPAPAPGYAGVIPATRIAPMLLGIAGVDANARSAPPEFWPNVLQDQELLKRLKALGYLGR